MSATCNLITGFLGTGKTTLIRHLLAQRPPGERWAVIVNEFGVVGIDGTTLAAEAGAGAGAAAGVRVEVREVAGGCICCAANVPLRVAITDVLRRIRPDRLLIEPSGLGHPSAILATLAEPGLSKALRAGPVLCVVDARHPLPGDDGTAPLDELWHDQLQLADAVIVNKRDLVDDARHAAFTAWLGTLYPPKQVILSTVEGEVPVSVLDTPRSQWRPMPSGTHHPQATAEPEVPVVIPGLGTRHAARSGATCSLGWLIDDPARPEAVLDADAIDRLMVRLAATASARGARLLRAKGALRTDQGKQLVEWTAGLVRSSPLTFTGPGRFELLFEATVPPTATAQGGLAKSLEQQLLDALLPRPSR